MSRVIKLTLSDIEACKKEFEEVLNNAKLSDGKISFNKIVGKTNRKATVRLSSLAWLKMRALIREFDKEVAWHGVATRSEDMTKDEYYISDILVYPQEVSGATVEMDVSKYEEWIRTNVDDDRFFNIGMQGHSHVNMSTSPSIVDITHQEMILEQLTDDMFYIFMIWNKRGEKNVKIYDLGKNILFENDDVDIVIEDDFISEAKEMVKERTYYRSSTYSTTKTTQTSVTNNIPKNDESKNNKPVEVVVKTGKNKRKGKRKNKRHNNTVQNSQTSILSGYDDMYDETGFYSNGYQ